MSSISIDIKVASPFPAEKVFKVFSDFNNIAPKVNPQVFKSIETIEGNGGIGTTSLFTFGDGVPFTSGKYRVDAIDSSNFTYNCTFFEGDNLTGILDSITNHVKVVPSADGASTFKQTVTYNYKGDEKPSAEILTIEKEIYEKTYKAIEVYDAAHLEAY